MKELIAVVSVLFIIFAVLSMAHSKDTSDENTIEGNTTTVDNTIAKYTWNTYQNSDVILNGDSITLDGGGAIVDDSIITILTSGTYTVSGTLDDGQIIIDAQGTDVVTLILNNADITCSSSAPVYVMNAEEVIITLEEGSENYVTDGNPYVYEDATNDEPNAAIFSKDDLVITGSGSITINANYNNGIQSKDDLEITGGKITVNAVNDGIKGRDSIVIIDAEITIDAGADGFQSNNDEDVDKGYVIIESGTLYIKNGEDGIQAETSLTINNGNIVIYSGEKGLKAGSDITINDGYLDIISSDDSIHSNSDITIENGAFVLSSSDDGIHADSTLTVNGGDINITKSYEGLESAVITINDGTIHLVSTDDGFNAVSSPDEGTATGWGGRPGQNQESTGNNYLYINGGYIVINSGGDGLDINGPISMTNGTVIINGPTRNDNGALDYSNNFKVTGGLLLAVGSAGMAQAPSISSNQYSVAITFSTALSANTIIHIESEDGTEILTFAPLKAFQSVVLSSPDLKNGETYVVYSGGSSTGSSTDGLYNDGQYVAGNQIYTFTVSGLVTYVGSDSYGGGGFPGDGGHH